MTALPVAATVAGAAFVLADALFRVWLGEDPVDSDLKDKMLAR